MSQELQIGGIYQHYKGNRYKVIGLARHTETLEELVVYQALYNMPQFGENSLWVRPKAMFLENVIIDGVGRSRFAFIGND